MNIFRITINVDGRDVQALVKAGVLATVETGSHEDKTNQRPLNKLSFIIGEAKSGTSAWVQVSKYEQDGLVRVTHEGWLNEGDGKISANSTFSPAVASLRRVQDPTSEEIKCQEDTEFGNRSCCTSYGSGCYVTCCGSCCSDSTRCPGASCCG